MNNDERDRDSDDTADRDSEECGDCADCSACQCEAKPTREEDALLPIWACAGGCGHQADTAFRLWISIRSLVGSQRLTEIFGQPIGTAFLEDMTICLDQDGGFTVAHDREDVSSWIEYTLGAEGLARMYMPRWLE